MEVDRYTHEDRIIILLFSIYGVILYLGHFNLVSELIGLVFAVLSLYEAFVTLYYCRNYLETVASYFIGFTGEIGIYEVLYYSFRNFYWDLYFLLFLIIGIYINIKSFKYANKC